MSYITVRPHAFIAIFLVAFYILAMRKQLLLESQVLYNMIFFRQDFQRRVVHARLRAQKGLLTTAMLIRQVSQSHAPLYTS